MILADNLQETMNKVVHMVVSKKTAPHAQIFVNQKSVKLKVLHTSVAPSRIYEITI